MQIRKPNKQRSKQTNKTTELIILLPSTKATKTVVRT